MAVLILIDTGTYKDGLNNIGDIVAIHDDGKAGTGVGYETFKIINVPGTAKEVSEALNAKLPEQKQCFRTSAGANEWSDEQPEEAEFWKDGEDWKKIEKRPKYQLNVTIDLALETNLANEELTDEVKQIAVVGATRANVSELSENQTVTPITEKAVEIEK